MRRSCLLKYHDVCFLLEYLFLLAMTSLTLGVFDTVSEAKCEYEDANLIWRNTPAYSLNDVKAMAWYKGKDSLIATWLEGKGFKEYPPYIGRLMQIGETGIKLKKANRSDSGSYWLSLTLASTDHKLEAVTHLEIIVAPSSKCKPNITEEGSILKAELPSEGCGTPPLIPKWKNANKTVIQKLQTLSLLDPGRNYESGEYVACAEGDSARCYYGNISDLCTGLTKSHRGRHDGGVTHDHISIILPTVLVPIVAVLVSTVVVIWFKRKRLRGDTTDSRQSEEMCSMIEGKPTDTDEVCPENVQYLLIEESETSRIGYSEIQNYLRRLYKGMTSVSLSPTGKENVFDVSDVYIDLDFQEMETSEIKYTETDLAPATSYNTSVSKQDIHIIKAHSQNMSPIVIVGCSGSGKSTWSKHLVKCWSRNSEIDNANVKGLNLPNLGEFQILLYLSLKSSDMGLSFQKLLENSLFQKQPEYLNTIMKYMDDKSYAKSILILIDGFDKISEHVKGITEFLDHKLLFSCTVVFTCRPSSFNPIVNACIDNSIQLKLFKVSAIPLESSRAYAGKVLSKLKRHNMDFNVNNFMTFTRNLHVQILLNLPYLCLTLLLVWMENKNPYIEITDILLSIVEHLLETATTDQRCKEKVMKLSNRNSSGVHTSVNKLDERFVKIKDLMYELSMTTDEIFHSKTKGLTDEERLFHESSARRKDTLPLEVLYEIGLITESFPLKSKEGLSKVTFTNVLIYQLFVSMAIAFRNGHALDYIVADKEVSLKNSMIIHMLWQFSPTLGREIFRKIRKLKGGKHESRGLREQNNTFRCSITKRSKGKKFHEASWLQLLIYKGDLNDEKLLFLTNALRSLDSLTSLVLENTENNNNLVFWLPCSQTLKRLALNINNCTLLLCPEWNKQIPIKLKEVVIKSVIISSRDEQILCNAFRSCKCIQKQEVFPTVVSTGDNEILP